MVVDRVDTRSPDARADGRPSENHLSSDLVSGVLLVVAAVAALALVADVAQYVFLDGFLSAPSEAQAARLATSDTWQQVVDTLTVATLLPAGGLFLWWETRAHRSLRPAPVPPRWSASWTVGGWFVPGANLIVPKLVVDDLWRSASTSSTRSDGVSAEEAEVPVSVHVWWACVLGALAFWVAAAVVGNAGFVDPATIADPGRARLSAALEIPASALALAAAMLAAELVVGVSRLVERAPRVPGVGSPPAPERQVVGHGSPVS